MGDHIRFYRSVFISDVHLGSPNCNALPLERFLKTTRCQNLFLVGDLVDVLKLRRSLYWPQEQTNIVRHILSMARKGVRVVYIIGNHDDFVGGIFDRKRTDLGNISIVDHAAYTAQDGLRYLVIHGDDFDHVIRYSWMLNGLGDKLYSSILAASRVFNRLRSRVGKGKWSLASFVKRRVRGAINLVYRYEELALAECRRRGFDGVICGHVHYPKMYEKDGLRYVNCGDWVESNSAVAEHLNGRFELLRLGDEESGQGSREDILRSKSSSMRTAGVG